MLADVERASTESVIEENLEHDIVAEPGKCFNTCLQMNIYPIIA